MCAWILQLCKTYQKSNSNEIDMNDTILILFNHFFAIKWNVGLINMPHGTVTIGGGGALLILGTAV